MEQRPAGRILPRVIVIAVAFMLLYFLSLSYSSRSNSVKQSNKADLAAALEADQVRNITITQSEDVPTGSVSYVDKEGNAYTFAVTDTTEIEKMLGEYGFKNYTVSAVVHRLSMISVITLLASIAFIMIALVMLFRSSQAGSGNQKMLDFGKSRAQMVRDGRTGFADVAGLEEEKEDLAEIVDFLKDPDKYTRIGARIPKGILLVGPPGTGKTLMARAIAGEAHVPFFSISGSDFVEMFVGVGASRVRDLFEDAKANRPCIVFIDEIDAVARRRGTGLGGGHDEREQTLNQLLVEMDGFGENSGIIVMAATNRVDILDPAILRPGRFDRKISVQRPDVKARQEILQVHSKRKPLADDVDLERIAKTTAGFTGADIENLLNESAIRAAKDNREFITQSDIDQAFIKVGIGAEKKSIVLSEKERRIVAYHEAGHAILYHVLPDVGPVHTISIIPTGNGAGGYTMPLPERDETLVTKGEMEQSIMVAMGGRIAEELIFGDVTTGASQDIKQATAIAHDMVTKYGMSEKVGMINCDDDEAVFIGRDMTRRSYGEHLSTLIDNEERRIIDECYSKAKSIIQQHMDVLHRTVEMLLVKEKLYQEEFEALFAENTTTEALEGPAEA